MRLEVISIGDELLAGHTVNTNLAYLGDALARIGHTVAAETCIPDTLEGIAQAVGNAAKRADVVVTIGGLGPTSDDVTRDAVANALECPLEFRQEVLEAIQTWLGERSVRVPETSMRVQAHVPGGGEWMPNRNGTAPGLWTEAKGTIVVSLPGPPRELRPMVEEVVLPRLRERFPPAVVTRTVPTAGIPESVLFERLEPVLAEKHPGVRPAYCAGPHRVDIRLVADSANADQLEAAVATTRETLPEGVLPPGCANLAQAVGVMLRERGASVATAESCTGGAIAQEITAVPGASDYFVGGVVVYANEWKTNWLGVPPPMIEQHGAVSAEVAEAMARGLRERTGADFAIAVTGIAGPGGGTEEKPVGLVFIAIGGPDGGMVVRHVFPGNRETVQRRTTILALSNLRTMLANQSARPPEGHGPEQAPPPRKPAGR